MARELEPSKLVPVVVMIRRIISTAEEASKLCKREFREAARDTN